MSFRKPAIALYSKNPFDYKEIENEEILEPTSIRTLAERFTGGGEFSKPTICIYNNKPLLRRDWNVEVKSSDLVVFAAVIGGDDDGDKDKGLRTFLLVVASAAAVASGGAVSAAIGAYGYSTLGLFVGGLVGAGVLYGLTWGIHELLPQPEPSPNVPTLPSPTYSFNSRANVARLGESIPSLYGRHIVYPDLASVPYLHYKQLDNSTYTAPTLRGSSQKQNLISNEKFEEEFLKQLYVIGQGEYNLEPIKLKDTNITSFPLGFLGSQKINPGENVTLFDSQIYQSLEVDNLELETNFSSGARTFYAYDPNGAPIQAKYFTMNPDYVRFDDDLEIWKYPYYMSSRSQYRYVYIKEEWAGPFTINPGGTLINAIEVDFSCPFGFGDFGETQSLPRGGLVIQLQARRIDDSGVAVGDWTDLLIEDAVGSIVPSTWENSSLSMADVPFKASIIIQGRNRNAFGISSRWAVVAGRYEVRMRHSKYFAEDWNIPLDWSMENTGWVHKTYWKRLKGVSSVNFTNNNITMLAVSVKSAEDIAKGLLNRLNVVAQRKLRTWSRANINNGNDGWTASPVPTNSIAWSFADICKSDYGGKLADDQIDLDKLESLNTLWQSRGDTFNGVFDNRIPIWDAMSQVLRAGRSAPVLRNGRVSVVRDSQNLLVTGMFNMRNILPNSLKVDYILPSENLPDKINVKYMEEDSWVEKNTLIESPDAKADSLIGDINFFGITNLAQVRREGIFRLNSNRLRRKIVVFQTEMEGYIPEFGSYIYVSHDMPAIGQSGEIVGLQVGSPFSIFEVSIDLEWKDFLRYYVILRKRDGSPAGPFEVFRDDESGNVLDSNKFRIASNIGIGIDIDDDREKTYFSFGYGTEWSMKGKVTNISPRKNDVVEITCLEDLPQVHQDTPQKIPLSNVLPVSHKISADARNYDLFEEMGRPNGIIDAYVEVETGVTLFSDNGNPALLIEGFNPLSTITIINNGRIIGSGGRGGNGCVIAIPDLNGYSSFPGPYLEGMPADIINDLIISLPTNGRDGGDAIKTANSLRIINNGLIYGGGGGQGATGIDMKVGHIYGGGGFHRRRVDIKTGFSGCGGAGNGGSAGYSARFLFVGVSQDISSNIGRGERGFSSDSIFSSTFGPGSFSNTRARWARGWKNEMQVEIPGPGITPASAAWNYYDDSFTIGGGGGDFGEAGGLIFNYTDGSLGWSGQSYTINRSNSGNGGNAIRFNGNGVNIEWISGFSTTSVKGAIG